MMTAPQPASTLDWLDANSPADPPPLRPEPSRDQWDRYLIPDPATGQPRGWTRATTIAKSIGDTFGLTRWEKAMVALGVAKHLDLATEIAALGEYNDQTKGSLFGLADRAKELGGGARAANMGTHLHAVLERVELGQPVNVPPQLADDVAAHHATRDLFGWTVLPELVERVVLNTEIESAGTMDGGIVLPAGLSITLPPSLRTLVLPSGALIDLEPVGWSVVLPEPLPLVGDYKTSKRDDPKFQAGEWAIQLSVYANAAYGYDAATGALDPMPWLSRQVAAIIHLPSGSGRCQLHLIDIEAGWEAAKLAFKVRAWRDRKDLHATQVKLPPVPALAEPPAAPAVSPVDVETAIADRWAAEMHGLRDRLGEWTLQRLGLMTECASGQHFAAGNPAVQAAYYAAVVAFVGWRDQMQAAGQLPLIQPPNLRAFDLAALDLLNRMIDDLGTMHQLVFDIGLFGERPAAPDRQAFEAMVRAELAPAVQLPATPLDLSAIIQSSPPDLTGLTPVAGIPTGDAEVEPPATTADEWALPSAVPVVDGQAGAHPALVAALRPADPQRDIDRRALDAMTRAVELGLLSIDGDAVTSNAGAYDVGKWFSGSQRDARMAAKEWAKALGYGQMPRTAEDAAADPVLVSLLAAQVAEAGGTPALARKRARRAADQPNGEAVAPLPTAEENPPIDETVEPETDKMDSGPAAPAPPVSLSGLAATVSGQSGDVHDLARRLLGV